MGAQQRIPCLQCNPANRHLCSHCHGTGFLGGGRPGNGCFGLLVVFISILFIVPSAIAGLIGAVLFSLGFKTALLPSSALTFSSAFKLAFTTSCLYLLTAAILAFILNGKVSEAQALKYFYFIEGHTILKFSTLVAFHAICIVATSLTLLLVQKQHFKGINGLLRGLIATAVIITPALLATFYLLFWLMIKYASSFYRSFLINAY